jgi:methylphosphotriester-DNA--protein-cysteine methyltransferase
VCQTTISSLSEAGALGSKGPSMKREEPQPLKQNAKQNASILLPIRKRSFRPSAEAFPVFQEATGHTIARYVNRVRVDHAKELIEATHLSMNEIGYLTGLNDPFYFSKVFKKYVGLSPTQYYKKVRETL